jgi:nitrate/nitrite transporter NarK
MQLNRRPKKAAQFRRCCAANVVNQSCGRSATPNAPDMPAKSRTRPTRGPRSPRRLFGIGRLSDDYRLARINTLTGYLVTVPYAFAMVAMIWWTRHSDITHERVWHVVCPAIVGGLSLIGAAYLGNPVLAAVALAICAMGLNAANATFWTLPTGFLTGSAAAGGIALINSIASLGGFAGPYAIRWIKDTTGEITLGLVVLAAGPIMAGVVIFLMGHDSRAAA